MRKSEMNSLVAGLKIQSKKDSTVYEIVGIDLEQGKVILDNGKLYTMGTIQRWYSLYEEEIPEVVEPDNTILDDIEQADELTSEQDTTADTEEQEDTDTTATTATNTPGTIRQNNLIRDINNLMDLHDVQMEAKKEYIKVSIPGKRGALCMIRQTRYGTGIHIDFKSKILAKLDENYRGMLIQDYNCQIYDKTRGYYRVFDCSDLDVLETIILTAKQVG